MMQALVSAAAGSAFTALTALTTVVSAQAFAQCSDSNNRFSVDASNGTVADTHTALMWQRCPIGLSGTQCETGEAMQLSLADVQTIANNTVLAKYSDWRLPTVKELSSLVDVRCYGPSIQSEVFPNTPSHYFWTDVKFSDDSRKSWVVSFYFGEDGVAYDSLSLHGRLVRNTETLASH